MKKIVPIIGLVLLFAMSILTHGETKEQTQLVDIVHLMEEQAVQIEGWRLYTRGTGKEVATIEEYEEQLHEILASEQDFQWDTTNWKDNEHWKVTGTNGFEQLTVLAYPLEDQYSMYLIYEFLGKGKPQDVETITSFFQERLDQLYVETPTVFTTVTGHREDLHQRSMYDFGSEIVEEFSAEKVEELKEETFISISAYTKQWVHSLDTNGNNMNLQIALRQDSRLGTKTTITIGTPIITTEY
ncbi:YwmB family TATA-box binding protein [Alkalihalobacterium alkalinitrilicum]|uniref:YwmB family TATA-box binding protein n=1 Tax=Alkalihalobacterium alkalinitrilicum TaxID=427920 RepID=UPI001303C393|nr:YwmB family TATA-box binding protein [Alkalihalobacterium alkalinitrilicum]